MSNVDPIGYATGSGGLQIEYRDPKAEMTQDDYLEVMVANLAQQDPFNTVDSTEFFKDFMTMGNYQAIQESSDNMEKVYNMQQAMLSQGLVGETVEVLFEELGTSDVGVVESSYVIDGDVYVVVNGVEHPYADVMRVMQPQQQSQTEEPIL